MTTSNTPICVMIPSKSLIVGDSMTGVVHRKLRKLRQVSPNSPQTKTVRAIIEDEFGYDFNPLIELVKLAKTTSNDMVAAQALSQVCKYAYPQLKSVETKSTTLHEVIMSDMELANRFRQYMGNTDTNE